MYSLLISEIISRFPLSLHEDQNVVIELASHKSSSRDLVGLQLWRGAFLLAEYLCHRQDLVKNSNIFKTDDMVITVSRDKIAHELIRLRNENQKLRTTQASTMTHS